MARDLAELGFRVQTDGLKRGQVELNKFDKAGRGAEQATGKLENRMSGLRAVALKLGPALGAISATLVAREVLQAAEAYTTLTNRLRLVTDGADELAAAQQAIFDISQDTRQPLTATAELYQRLAMNQDALALSGQDLADITKTISQTLVISGTSAQASEAALVQLGQAFASGTLRGEELNSVLEQAPALAQAIAEGMDVTVGQLRALGQEGTLTAEAVVNALQDQAKAVEDDFGRIEMTVGGALTNVSGAFTRLVGEFDEATGATSAIASAIDDLAGLIAFAADSVDDLASAWEWFNTSKYTNVIARTTNITETFSQLSLGLFELGRRAGLWNDSLDDLGEELTRTIPLHEALAGAAKKAEKETSGLAVATEDLAEAQEEVADAYEKANKEAEKQIKRLDDILRKIYPQQTEVNRLSEEWEFLRRTLEGVDGAQQTLSDWWDAEMPKPVKQTSALTDALENSKKALQGNKEASDDWEAAYNRGVERMRDATGDFFQKMLLDGEASFGDLGDMFKRLVAEMVATAATAQIGNVLSGKGFSAPSANMQSVLAGGAGFMASNAVFGQTSGAGSGLAGLGAAALGLGPLGVGLAAFAGGGIESLFGGNNNGENSGRAQLNLATGRSTIGGVGKTFDEASVSQAQALADFATQVAQRIGGSNAQLDIVSGRSGIRVGDRNFAADDVAGAMDTIFERVVGSADQLDMSLRNLINGFNGTNEQALQFADAILTIDALSSRSPVEELMRSLATGPQSLMDVYQQQADMVDTLRRNFDGSAMAAQEYAQALQSSQQAAVAAVQALNQVSQQSGAAFGSTAQRIRESVLSPQELRQQRAEESETLFKSIGRAESAQELSSISSRLNELLSQRFSSIQDPTAQQAEKFAQEAERASALIEQRSQRLIDNVVAQQEKQNAQTQRLLQQAAGAQQAAADTMLRAAGVISSAAGRFASAGGGNEVNA